MFATLPDLIVMFKKSPAKFVCILGEQGPCWGLNQPAFRDRVVEEFILRKTKFILGLGLINAATFLLLVVFVPRKTNFTYTGSEFSRIINSVHWETVFAVSVANLLISGGVFFLIDSFQNNSSNDG